MVENCVHTDVQNAYREDSTTSSMHRELQHIVTPNKAKQQKVQKRRRVSLSSYFGVSNHQNSKRKMPLSTKMNNQCVLHPPKIGRFRAHFSGDQVSEFQCFLPNLLWETESPTQNTTRLFPARVCGRER